MKEVYIVSDNVISAVGTTAAQNFAALQANQTGVALQDIPAISRTPFYASLIRSNDYQSQLPVQTNPASLTRFESLLTASIATAAKEAALDLSSPDNIMVLSSTKGNISLLENAPLVDERLTEAISLQHSAKAIARVFNTAEAPLVISNACISGLTALLTGKRLLQSGNYKYAIVAGADLITSFILSGFQSFQAVSSEPCKPFDASRNGITLGEAAATIILSTEKRAGAIQLAGGAISNDANHISGPSRTGQELCMAINKAMQQANVRAGDIGFISAHGTATLYNDEMEAKAFSLAGLEGAPLHSLKGYYGHTLGAAGVLESVIAIRSLQSNSMIGTRGYKTPGVSKPVTVCAENMPLQANHCLKTASGFGGCNAALVFSKTDI